MSEWEEVGVFGVDAGICWIGDPGYCTRHEYHTKDKKMKAVPPEKALGESWHDFCEKYWELTKNDVAQFPFDNGTPGLGVAISTGGDGTFPVFVKRKYPNGPVKEIKIVIMSDGDQ